MSGKNTGRYYEINEKAGQCFFKHTEKKKKFKEELLKKDIEETAQILLSLQAIAEKTSFQRFHVQTSAFFQQFSQDHNIIIRIISLQVHLYLFLLHQLQAYIKSS